MSHILSEWFYSIHIKVKVKLATLVESYPKAPFSIPTTPRYRGRLYSFPWIIPLYPWSLPYNAECQSRWYQVPFLSLCYDSKPSLSDHWPTLLIWPINFLHNSLWITFSTESCDVLYSFCACLLHHLILSFFHGSLSENKSPQVSRTLHSILADLPNTVVRIVPTRPSNYKSSSSVEVPVV